MKKHISIIIPAYNEQNRIERTLRAYHSFFSSLKDKNQLDYSLIVVLNGCVDNTAEVVTKIADELDDIFLLDLKKAGKGYAIKQGFAYALQQPSTLIGFVDADMATDSEQFYRLVQNMDSFDGVIASRYMKGSIITPPRPKFKRWGSKLIYEPLVRMVLGLRFHDLQCGAKLFKRNVIETIVNRLTIDQWAFDIELLYLCRKNNFIVKEVPTEWHDKADSKLNPVGAGLKMLKSVWQIRSTHL